MATGGGALEFRVVEVELPNGATALVRVADLGGVGASKTGVRDKFDFQGVAATLEGITDAIKSALVKAAPDKVTVELGIEMAVKSGKLTGLLVEGEGKGALTVTLEWGNDGAT